MKLGMIQNMQALLDDEIDILTISCPPGIGKTSLGEFFMTFVMGHNPNSPNLMSSHSGYMTRMFYEATLNIIKSNEYCWSEVFPKVEFESTNAKEETINLGRFQPFKTLTCRPIRASLTGVTRCESYLYCDDLVSGIEEALSKERLDKLYGEYTTDLKSRKKKLAKEIHISTRWSVHDVIGRLERQYGDYTRARFLAIPDIDPTTGKSNFDYDYNVGFDEKYFEDMAASMDDVSYRCLFKSDPIEREGLLYHPEDLKRYLGGLPDKDPDAVLGICDTKDTGVDYNALGVFYQYNGNYYLEDVVYKNIDPGTLDQLNSDMLVKHSVQECQFESNKEGSRTANEVERLVKEKGGRCHITKKYSTQNKETKIIVNSAWVKEHVYFKDPTEYDPRSDYGLFMSNVCSYTQLGKNKSDDAPDMLAMFALFVDSLYGSQVEVLKRSEVGF
ncbi:MAG: phage terminase large subunit [Lachnospiraceae bacterium]|nr:phage terminase large subunit [Lachnospiraceae bacterium]